MHLVSANCIKHNCGLLMEPIYYGEEEVIPKINSEKSKLQEAS